MQRRKGTPDEGVKDMEELSIFLGSESQSISGNENSGSKRRRLDFFYFLRHICCYWWGCAGCCLLLIFIVVLFINEGHHMTCALHGALCTPFREYIARFPLLPRRRTGFQTPVALLPHSCARFEDFLAQRNHHGRRVLFLIGESRGGSTYTYDTLNLHPEISMVGGEALFAFSNKVCNNNELLLRNHESCTFANWLDALYTNAYDLRPRSHHVVGTKINIEQIPPEFYNDFSSYLACIRDSAIILHVSRASTIASFLNYQAEVPERLYEGNWRFHSTSVAKALESSLELDPELAADWVHHRDALSQDLSRTLGFGAPLPLLYQRVYYEHLKDSVVGDQYWKGVFAFMDVDPTASVKAMREAQNRGAKLRTHNKTHGNAPCNERISNWEAVKEALGPESLSSLACEAHS